MKINSFEENEFVLKLVNQCQESLKQVWIGLTWKPQAGKFFWSDNSVPFFEYWAPKEPSGFASEPCGHMYTGQTDANRPSGSWNDIRCEGHPSNPNGPVCKRLNRVCH